MRTNLVAVLALLLSFNVANAARLLVEAESFTEKGGWVVDQQFMDLMGSPYLMAHGLGEPVDDAGTKVSFPETGTYYVYVRTFNWTSPWKKGEGPGKFKLSVNGKKLSPVLGTEGEAWIWQSAGKVSIKKTEATVGLHDLTGFNGRCDAIYFTTEEGDVPPSDLAALGTFRKKELSLPDTPPTAGTYDLVVVGGGVAGISAAVSAARLGCKVALINDRPVLGGNNSSEIRVHLGGRIESGSYKELGNLQKEFGPTRGGNAQPADYYEDDKKDQIVANEKNITLFSNFRAIAVNMNGSKIASIIAKHIESGEEKTFVAPVFSDCTGDGTIGYLAGADFTMGRESKEEFGEETAPDESDKMTMGASVQWYSVDEKKPTGFPLFNYGVKFTDASCEKVTMGEWTWETGMNYDQIKDFERIRDYGLLVVYSNWSYLKNELRENDLYKNRKLGWVAYIAGKRESRRLLGDYILKEADLTKYVVHEDGTAATTWTIDLHYPDPKNTANFPGAEFKSIAKHTPIHPYPIPYRCFYSRNIDNLFMAGRNISVTHVALGTVRVMRTTGMMGEVVGMAASLCKKYNTNPRGIYRYHLNDLKELLKEGVGQKGLPNNQKYNEGGTLKNPPTIK
ncbi:FAD-dependent oxidoreductase [Massilibacteroides sp.]|uniref:FAD-dependent oxidoreductase n=1 Tax=Massilibacteroides sp. TaxID=2034766 RepID=UPI002624FE82|nr:FAD-dependent oxidoreductase [Massilibacteroides sp.]MDD4515025.1 FAD-dependent oxidoreductase [Massilibacteroides sp.]